MGLTVDRRLHWEQHLYRVGQKLDCFGELITLRMLMVKRRMICQTFANFVASATILHDNV